MSSPTLPHIPRSIPILPLTRPEVTNLATARPVLSLSIPDTVAFSSLDPTTSINQQTVGAFASNGIEKNDNNDSDKSSICESPVWYNAEIKQKKKHKKMARDQRRKGKEIAEKDAKVRAEADVKVAQKRLAKAPPVDKLSKTAPGYQSYYLPPTPNLTAPVADNYYSERRGVSSRENSGKDFLPSEDEETHLHHTPRRTGFQKIDSTRHVDGFLGGMKLKLAQGDTHESLKEHREKETPNQAPNSATSSSAKERPIPPLKKRKRLQKMRRHDTRELKDIPVGLGRLQQDKDMEFAAKIMVKTLEQPSIKNDSAKPEHEINNSIIETYFPNTTVDQVTSQDQDPANYRQSEVVGSQTNDYRFAKKAVKPSSKTGQSSERPPISYREPAILNAGIVRGRSLTKRNSYAAHPQQDTQDNCIDIKGDNSSKSEMSHGFSRNRSWSIRSLSRRMRSISRSRGTASSYTEDVMANNKDIHYEPGSDNTTIIAQTYKTKSATSSIEQQLKRRRGLTHLNQIISFPGIKTAAKSAFSKHSHSSSLDGRIDGEAINNLEHPQAQKLVKRAYSNRTTTKKDFPKTNNLAADGISPQPVCNLASHNPLMTPHSGFPGADHNAPHILPHEHGNSSFETTKSGRISMSAGESVRQNITPTPTTPASSRPQSQKANFLDTSQASSFPQAEFENLVEPASNLESSRSLRPRPGLDSSDTILSLVASKELTTISNSKGTHLQDASIPEAVEKNLDRKQFPLSRNLQDLSDFDSREPDSENILLGKDDPKIVLTKDTPVPQQDGSGMISPGRRFRGAKVSALATPKIRFPKVGEPTQMSKINPIAKMLVICCSCRYFQDIPSKLYELMAKPDDLVKDTEKGISGVISTTVKCPWCGHGMSTTCCEGYTGVVYLTERLH